MTPIKEFGECLISAGNEDYFFRPSFVNMSRIGSPQEIVQAFYDLHNEESVDLIRRALSTYGTIPAWVLKHVQRPGANKKAVMAAVSVMQACCDRDISLLTGELVPGCSGRWGFVWKQGAIHLDTVVIIAQSLITHGVVGKAKVRKLQRHENGSMTTEFYASEYINSARNHLGMTREEAESLTMTEFIMLLNAKYPQQEGFTKEEYDAVVDDYFAMKKQRLSSL